MNKNFEIRVGLGPAFVPESIDNKRPMAGLLARFPTTPSQTSVQWFCLSPLHETYSCGYSNGFTPFSLFTAD